MNKIKILFVMLGMCLAIPFVSCDKEEDEPIAPQTNPIVNTSWAWENWLYSLVNGGTWYEYIEFTDTKNYKHYYKKVGGVIKQTSYGTYKYIKALKTVTLYHEDGSEWNTFQFNSNMTQMWPKTNSDAIFEKQ